jgi:hypothetical protein
MTTVQTARARVGVLMAVAAWLAGSWMPAAAAPAGTPFGNFERADATAGGISIKGWVVDPSTASPIYVWVTVDGVGRHEYAAKVRADVGAALPLYGPSHGFSMVLPSSPGEHRVCVTASNVGPGAHQWLGCRTVTVLTGSPVGNFESAVAGEGVVTIKGWAIDPDTAGPVYAWVTVDGVGRHVYADQERRDVAEAFPGYGPEHGFRRAITVSPGTHRLCVTASGVGAGSHTPLGCRTVTAAGEGSLDPFRAAWAADLCATERFVTRRVLSHDIRVNPKAVDAFGALDRVLRDAGYEARWTSAYSCRLIAGTERFSLHSYGIALDIDPNENPFRSPTSGSVRFSAAATREGRAADVAANLADTIFTPEQIAAVEAIRTVDGRQVWGWGGRWRTPLDAMHFELKVTPEELARGLDPATTG